MKQKIVKQDLQILRKLFAPKSAEIDVIDSEDEFEVNELEGIRAFDTAVSRCLITSGKFDLRNAQNYSSIIQFGSSKETPLKYKTEFRCIQMNHSIRWVYPKGKMNSIFDFYHASTLRAKLLKMGLRALGMLKLDVLVAKKLTVHTQSSEVLQCTVSEVPFSDFSVFMGTPGAERTVMVSLLNGGKNTAFLKFGLSSLSQFNVSSEGLTLFRLNRNDLKHLEVPTVKSTREMGLIAISKLSAPNKSVSNSFQKEHAEALIEMAELSRTCQMFSDSTFGEAIMDNWVIISRSDQSKTELGQLLQESYTAIPHDLHYSAGLAHGDFTPWNMFTANDKLYLYDWELSIRNAPSFFDLFHFHFLSGIFLNKWTFNEIYTQIKFTIESHEELQSEIERSKIDIKKHLELYLLYTVSRKMALTVASGVGEELLEKNLSVWLDAFLFVLPERASNRAGFITEFEVFLNGFEHAFLKFNAKSLRLLPESSDLDLAIEPSAISDTIKFCTNHRFVKRSRSVTKSFMTTVELFFEDGRYLSIDLIHDFRRKWKQFMDIRELLCFASKNQYGISVPALEHDLEYTLLFYTLNGADVPTKYVDFFGTAHKKDQLRALRYFQNKYLLTHSSIASLLTSFNLNESAFELYFIKESSFKPIQSVKARWNYLVDVIKEKIGKRGFMLTISGVDGVGKSTVIELLKEQLEAKYRKQVVLMRHRPKVLPILSTFKYGSVKRAESNATHLTPNKVSKKSIVGSYLRFFYYYLDYVLGQFYIHARYIWGGKIVLYDRYYFDIINHPQRTNLVVNRTFAKWLYRPIIQPEMNIFLNASPEEITKRKRELTKQQITQLSSRYLSLFREFSRKYSSARYVVHRNDHLSTTVSEILQDIQQIA